MTLWTKTQEAVWWLLAVCERELGGVIEWLLAKAGVDF